MRWNTFAIAIILPWICAAQTATQWADQGKYVHIPFNVGLVHGISVGDAVAEETGRPAIHDGFSLALISSKAARLDGVSISGILSQYTEDARGLVIAPISLVGGDVNAAQIGGVNVTGGALEGAQFGYLVNIIGSDARAAQFGGIANVTGGSYEGAQFGGVANLAGGAFRGAQFGGIVNVAGEKAEGAQFGGIANLTGSDFRGAQFGGIANATDGNFEGAQFGGIANINGGEFEGAQFAGLVNIAVDVKGGFQIAPVNISKSNDGIPIGLISYVEEVGFRYDVWGSEMGFVHAGLRSGNKHFYNVLAVGVAPGDSMLWSVGAGFGGHFDVSRQFALEAGVFGQYLHGDGDLDENPNILGTLSVNGVFDLGPLWLTAGPTLNVWVSEDRQDTGLVPFDVYDEQEGEVHILAWPGFAVGLRF